MPYAVLTLQTCCLRIEQVACTSSQLLAGARLHNVATLPLPNVAVTHAGWPLRREQSNRHQSGRPVKLNNHVVAPYNMVAPHDWDRPSATSGATAIVGFIQGRPTVISGDFKCCAIGWRFLVPEISRAGHLHQCPPKRLCTFDKFRTQGFNRFEVAWRFGCN